MGFSQAIAHNFRNYATFHGRAQRSQFWWWWLFTLIVSIITNAIDGLAGFRVGSSSFDMTVNGQIQQITTPGTGIITIIASLVLFLPTLAVAVRRLHDTDRTGWWVLWGGLLAIVCCIGFIILLVFYLQRGTSGPNRFGSDPLTT